MNIFLILMTILSLSASYIAHGALKFHIISGDAKLGSLANSIIIEGEQKLILVDTQRTISNAQKLLKY